MNMSSRSYLYPSRPAPTPPSGPRTPYLPVDHPFASALSSRASRTSLQSNASGSTVAPSYQSSTPSLIASPSSTAVTQLTGSSGYSYSSRQLHRQRSPTFTLAAPLTPARPTRSKTYKHEDEAPQSNLPLYRTDDTHVVTPNEALARQQNRAQSHSLMSCAHASYSHRNNSSAPCTFSSDSNPTRFTPTELAVLNHKPRQTLLADIEYIVGKKLHFPFIDKHRERKQEYENRTCIKVTKTTTTTSEVASVRSKLQKVPELENFFRDEVVILEKDAPLYRGGWV